MGIGESLEEKVRESPDCYQQILMCNSREDPEDQNADRYADSKGQVDEVSERMRTPLGFGLEVIHVPFWKRTCLCFVHALRLCVRPNLKVMN